MNHENGGEVSRLILRNALADRLYVSLAFDDGPQMLQLMIDMAVAVIVTA